jgi:aryl-alcohol dehydrogenase-like predicted oxidoreductase
MQEVENSLRRLDTDYIDLYQAHRPDLSVDIDETLGALSDLVHQGKVRVIGSSTYPAELIVEAQWTAERRGRERFRCEQPPYSIFARAIETSVLPTCQKYGMGVIPWSPLAGGWLTGKYRRGEAYPSGSRMTLRPDPYEDLVNDETFEGLEAFAAVAADRGVEPATLAVAWVLAHPQVTSVVVGPRRPEQLATAVAATELELTLGERDELADLFA